MRDPKALTDKEEIKTLKRAAKRLHSYKHYALLELGFNTGLRLAEMLPLSWEQVLQKDGSIRDSVTIKESVKKRAKRTAFFNRKVKDCLAKLRIMHPSDTYLFHSDAVNRREDKPYWAEASIKYFLRDIEREIGKRQVVTGGTMRASLLHHLAPGGNLSTAEKILSYCDEDGYRAFIGRYIKTIFDKIDM